MSSLFEISAAVGGAAIFVLVFSSTTFIPLVMSGFFIAVFLLAVVFLLLARSVYFLGQEEQLGLDMFTETVVINGPGVKFINPFTCRMLTKHVAHMLGNVDFVRLQDSVTGSERVVRGPQILFLGPYEKVTLQGKAVTLSETQCILLMNQLSGVSSLKSGPIIWFPESPHEVPSSVSTAIALQEHEAPEQDHREGNCTPWRENGVPWA